jgi:hypothetical protein
MPAGGMQVRYKETYYANDGEILKQALRNPSSQRDHFDKIPACLNDLYSMQSGGSRAG